MLPAVIIDEKLFESFADLPEEARHECGRAITNLTYTKYRARAISLEPYGQPNWYSCEEAEGYLIIFSYPEPPRQPGGPSVVFIRNIVSRPSRLPESDFYQRLLHGVWDGLCDADHWLHPHRLDKQK